MEEAAGFINARPSVARYFEPISMAPYAKWVSGEPGGRGGQFAGKATVSGKFGSEVAVRRAGRAATDLDISFEEAYTTPDEELEDMYEEQGIDTERLWETP